MNVFSKVKNELRIWRNLIRRRLYVSSKTEKEVIERFHQLYYGPGNVVSGFPWHNTRWLGTKVFKCPLDLWVYQEIISELKPDVIIECGTADGGGTLFFASMCDLMDKGSVISVDYRYRENLPKHERITYVTGSSIADETFKEIKKNVKPDDVVMVVLDSDHTKKHVLNELHLYGKLVTLGSYLIVEDTNINGHPVASDFGPGPAEAVEEFMSENRNFFADKSKEKFYLTFNPGGYLKRIK